MFGLYFQFGNLGQTMDKYEDGTTKFPLNNAMTVTDGAICKQNRTPVVFC